MFAPLLRLIRDRLVVDHRKYLPRCSSAALPFRWLEENAPPLSHARKCRAPRAWEFIFEEQKGGVSDKLVERRR